MSQVTIYVPEEDARAIRRAAKRAGRSVSEWARLQMMARPEDGWPSGYFEVLGALRDDTLQRPAQPALRDDVRREIL